MTESRKRRLGLFTKKPGKLVYCAYIDYMSDTDEEEDTQADIGKNETDRIPREINVKAFDLVFYIISMATYIMDVISDCVLAWAHYADGRVWSGICIALFSFLPSIILNIVAFLWMFDDNYKKRVQGNIRLKALICILQAGPLLYYWTAFRSGVKLIKSNTEKEKRRHFKDIVAAERDATLLRFFEAFMESAPQLLIQGFLFAISFWAQEFKRAIPNWAYLQVASIFFSLLSVSWSISIQHRALRLSRPDKSNMLMIESVIQLIWRMATILSRYLVLITLCLAKSYWIVPFFAIHYVVSVIQVSALQSVSVVGNGSPAIEIGLILINGCIHFFAPFNMAEGSTRVRYLTAYSIEAIEAAAIFAIALTDKAYTFPLKYELIYAAIGSFIGGLFFMAIYYLLFHPTRRDHDFLAVDCVTTDESADESKRMITRSNGRILRPKLVSQNTETL